MTNLVAITLLTITIVTNNIVSLHPSGEEKHVTPVVVSTHIYEIQGQRYTNEVRVTNATVRLVWCEVPIKCDRKPLGVVDAKPPMPVK